MTSDELRRLRLRYGMTQGDLERCLKYKSKGQISRYERGTRTISPRMEQAILRAMEKYRKKKC